MTGAMFIAECLRQEGGDEHRSGHVVLLPRKG